MKGHLIYLKSKIDKDKENNVESEKAILRIMSRQNELHGLLHALKAETDRLGLEKADYDRELAEAGMLIGREASLLRGGYCRARK